MTYWCCETDNGVFSKILRTKPPETTHLPSCPLIYRCRPLIPYNFETWIGQSKCELWKSCIANDSLRILKEKPNFALGIANFPLKFEIWKLLEGEEFWARAFNFEFRMGTCGIESPQMDHGLCLNSTSVNSMGTIADAIWGLFWNAMQNFREDREKLKIVCGINGIFHVTSYSRLHHIKQLYGCHAKMV